MEKHRWGGVDGCTTLVHVANSGVLKRHLWSDISQRKMQKLIPILLPKAYKPMTQYK